MKDLGGIECNKGDFVQVTLNPLIPPLTGWIQEIKEGGIIVQSKQQQGVVPSEIVLALRIILTDAMPGTPHPFLRRIPNPDTEIVVPKATLGGDN